MTMMPVKIGYWKIRGLSAPLVYLCRHAGIDYELVEYAQGPAPSFNKEAWLSKKFNLGLDFPNLPYVIDGDFRVSETVACTRYLCDKYAPALLGRTPTEIAQAEMVWGLVWDLRNATTGPCYSQSDRAVFAKNWANIVPKLVKFLGNKRFLIGDQVTYNDFFFYELIETVLNLGFPDVLKTYPSLERYRKNVRSLPGLREYLDDPNARDNVRNFNNESSKINGKGSQVNTPKHAITLEYFDFNGRALPTRLIFERTKTQYDDFRLSDFTSFGTNKASGKYKFSQVPVIWANGKQITQSIA